MARDLARQVRRRSGSHPVHLVARRDRSAVGHRRVARDALRRQLAVLQFEEVRRQIMPFAEARGYLTDEDIFRAVS